MAYIQRTAPPQNKITPFNINTFNGGFNNRSSMLQSNEASDMRNMIFYDQVVLEKRKGSLKKFDCEETIKFLDRWQPYTGSDCWIKAGDTTMEIYDGSDSVVIPLGTKGMDGENFQGHYFFVDGAKLRVWGDWSKLVANTYLRIVGTNPGTETDIEVVSTPDTYTALDTTYKKGVIVYDFNQNKVWYEPCANEKADPYLGVSAVPANPRYIASLSGRLYLSGSNRDNDNVFISSVGNPYYFPPSLPIQVPPNSDSVTGLCVYDNAVVVGRKHDIHIITGVTNNPETGFEMFKLTKLNTHTGLISNKTVNVAHNYLFFLGWDGNAYALSSVRNDTKVLSTTLISRQIDLHAKPFYFTHTEIANAVSHFQDSCWYLSINEYVFVYDYRIQAWALWDSLNITSFFNLDGVMYWCDSAHDMCTFSTDFSDKGVPFFAYWESSAFDFGDPVTYKQFRDFYIVGHTFKGEKSNIRFYLGLDYSDSEGIADIGMQQALWGIAKFGEKFVKHEVNASAPFTIGKRARSIKIKLMNGYQYKDDIVSEADLTLKAKTDGDMYYCPGNNQYYIYHLDTDEWIGGVYADDLNQPMRVYGIYGEFELRGKR